MDVHLMDDEIVDQFARSIIRKYQPNRQWRTHTEYENEVKDLKEKIVERFNRSEK